MKRTWMAASFLIAALVAPARADTAPALPVAVPFELLITKHMVVTIKINGKGPYRVIFDTGAPVTLLSNKVGKATGLIGKDGASTSFSLFGPVAQTNAKKLELGGLRAEKVPVIVMDHPS
ncbi:MAG: serine protease, partial [Planctomycetota bacterium]